MAEILTIENQQYIILEEELNPTNISLTSDHFQYFLKYISTRKGTNSPKYSLTRLTDDLNKLSGSTIGDKNLWKSILHEWIRKTVENASLQERDSNLMIAEEKQLLEILDFDRIKERQVEAIKPSAAEIIIGQLKNGSTWLTIASEIKGRLGVDESSDHWRRLFESLCSKVARKKKLIDDARECYKPSLLSEQEKLIASFIQEDDGQLIRAIFDDCCRVCLSSNGTLTNIFEQGLGGLATAVKIGLLAETSPISKNDGFPQHICENCLKSLDAAYHFKATCERSDEELRRMAYDERLTEHEMAALVENQTQPLLVIFEDQEHDGEDETDTHYDTETIEDETGQRAEESGISEEPNTVKFIVSIPNEAITVVNTFICDICSASFKSKSALKMHQSKHSNERPFVCSECKRLFKTRLCLRVHMRSHTGERPYMCSTCGKRFRTCSAVSNHKASHSNTKDFPCSQCSYRGNTKANLRVHLRSHSDQKRFACTRCDQKFKTASNMHKHARNIHEKMRTHKCDQCERTFFSKESARKHIVTHTGQKPYNCPLCPIAYGWYNGLQKHMRSQHPGVKPPKESSYANSVNIIKVEDMKKEKS